MRKYPKLTQSRPFKLLRYNISIYAMKLLEKEQHDLQQLLNADSPLGNYHCEILLRYNIPCKHYLLRGYYSGEPLPRSLLHPRWWLQGPSIRFTNWHPKYPEEEEEEISTITPVDNREQRLAVIQQELDIEGKHRFTAQIEQLHRKAIDKALQLGKRYLQL